VRQEGVEPGRLEPAHGILGQLLQGHDVHRMTPNQGDDRVRVAAPAPQVRGQHGH
jgi:hypothetical protein